MAEATLVHVMLLFISDFSLYRNFALQLEKIIQRDTFRKKMPKSPYFEGKEFEVVIFRQFLPSGRQNKAEC
jgi:hypothetical protein